MINKLINSMTKYSLKNNLTYNRINLIIDILNISKFKLLNWFNDCKDFKCMLLLS